MRILVCDDDPMILKTIEFRLGKEGYEVIPFPDGRQALDYLDANNQVDLVITDLLLPFINGLGVITHIRKDLGLKTPIIVLSKVGAEDTVMDAFNFGADDYITKPFSPNELSIRTKRLLANSIV